MVWTEEQAKKHFEELVEKARKEGPQEVHCSEGDLRIDFIPRVHVTHDSTEFCTEWYSIEEIG
jgi:hypothetical protein